MPLGAEKSIGGDFLKKCTLLELLIAGKCIMLAIALVASAGNPLILSGIVSATRSIIRD